MKQWMGEIWRFVLITVLGFIGSMIAGLLNYGGNIFDPQMAGFAYYIVFGFSTALIFAFYHMWGLSSTIVGALGISTALFIMIALFVPFWPIFNLAFWLFAVNMSVVVSAFLFERKLSYFKHWKFIVVSIIYGSLFVLLTLIVGLFKGITMISAEVFQKIFIDGVVLGVGLGIGVEIAESIIHSVDLHKQAKREAR
jgi:hypothetical protein